MRTLLQSTCALALLALAPSAAGQVWTWGDHIQPVRGFFVAAAVGDLAFFAGGTSAAAAWPPNLHAEVNVYDASSESWSMAMLSEARYSLAATAVGSQILFGGGAIGFAGQQSVFPSARVDIYDSAIGHPTNPAAWSVSAPLSEARTGLTATSVGGYALFAGGIADLPGGGTAYSAVVDAYHAATGTWSQAQLSTARNPQAVAVGPYALFAGGLGVGGQPVDSVDVYDSTVGPPSDPTAWSVATMSEPRFAFGVTSVGNLAFFAGGNLLALDTVDVYDAGVGPPTDPAAWTVEHLSAARWVLTATAVGPYAMFAGGHEFVTGTIFDLVDIYDSRTGTWSTANLSQARRNLFATTAGGRALFAGGKGGIPQNTLPVVDIFTPLLPEIYCSPAAVNSTGLPGIIRATGSYLVTDDDLTLTADQLPPGQFGYFLGGMGNGVFAPPNSSGIICLIGAPIARFNAPPVQQGPTFSLMIDTTSIPLSPPQAIMPGETWKFCFVEELTWE